MVPDRRGRRRGRSARGLTGGVALAVLLALRGCANAPVDKAAAELSDASDGRNWPAFGRTYGEQHYSPLAEIDTKNIGQLGLAWSLDLPARTHTVTQPLAVDGVLYISVGHSQIHAIDAKSGRILWHYDSKAADMAGAKLRQGWGSRGLAWWSGKIFAGTQDGRLIAIDAKTGKPVWSVLTVGKDDYRFISGAPRVFDGKVVIGHGGADASNVRGYVTAYDAQTGRQLWRFHTVPGNPADGFENDAMRMAAETWSGEWWKYGGGGTVWNAITYDPQYRQIYIGTGNGAPWNHRIRSQGKGDNLFLSSIVALDADSGAYKWHYQTNPGESWDYNASMDMQIAALDIGGRRRDVLMTAPKNGFFYVLDRATGKLISAEHFVPVTWAKKIDLVTGRPVEAANVRYDNGSSFILSPSPLGGHNWLPMAYSPKNRLVYIPAIELSARFSDKGIDTAHWTRTPGNAMDVGAIPEFVLDEGAAKSALVAWDPVTQKERWRMPTPGYWNGGVMATGGGLVFQGRIDGRFNAYDAESGKLLWSYDGQSPVIAPPISYKARGVQYVTVLTGMNGGGGYLGPLIEKYKLDPNSQARRVLTFMIGGKAKLPPTTQSRAVIDPDPDYRPQPEQEARGGAIYGQRCAPCHGVAVTAVGAAPDLRASPMARSAEVFRAVVSEGVMQTGGMPRFEEFSEQQLEDMRQYIRAVAMKDGKR